MLAIILSVLKIIGIVLLWILGILLAAILLILFLPITYHGVVRRTEADGDPPVYAKVKASWLFGFIRACAGYPQKPYVRVNILWHEMFRIPEDGTHPEKKTGKIKKAGHRKSKKNSDQKSTAQDTAENPHEKIKEDEVPCIEQQKQENKDTDTGENENTGNGFFSRIVHFISQLPGKIKYTLYKIYDKIKNIVGKTENIRNEAAYYLNIIKSEEFADTFKHCKKQVICIFHQLLPRYFQADIIEGTGDPASTAQILAIFGVLYPFICDHVDVRGDFENITFKANVVFHGRITIFMIIYAGCRLYFNKDVRKLVKQLKKED